MIEIPTPLTSLDDAGRLEELLAPKLLASPIEPEFDNLTQLASEICDTPVGSVEHSARPPQVQGRFTLTDDLQRLATQSGVPAAILCGSVTVGQKQLVKYTADYIFWRAA